MGCISDAIFRISSQLLVHNKDINHYTQPRNLLGPMYNQWVASVMPFFLYPPVAVGVYNNNVCFFGVGLITKLKCLDMESQTTTTFNHNQSISGFAFSSTFSVQINELVYWIDSDLDTITSYDLSHKHILDTKISLPQKNVRSRCLASNNKYLYVIGNAKLQIFNIFNGTWMMGPEMINNRSYHTCIVNIKHDILYVIGGKTVQERILNWRTYYDIIYVESIGKVSLRNIQNQNWEYIDFYPIQFASAISYKDYIIVIGGGHNKDVSSDVTMINCITDQISSGGNLNYSVQSAMVVMLNQTIYAFGGYVTSTAMTSQWQYAYLSTESPTESPTVSTTVSPTTIPSNDPTIFPTYTTTNDPTISLSTSDPSTNPTINPIMDSSTFTTTLASNIINSTMDSSTFTTNVDNYNKQHSQEVINNKSIIGIVIAVCILLCLVIIFVFGYYKKKKMIQLQAIGEAVRKSNQETYHIVDNFDQEQIQSI
eukprot:537585_1